MARKFRLTDYYLPPVEGGFVLESLVATTYQVDFDFLEEELLAAALGVCSPVSRLKAFRSEIERKLQRTEVSVLYDLGGCERLARLSPRIDAVPVNTRKLHAKISLLMWIRENVASGAPPDRRIRLIVGSANLTRPGFRQNYESVVALDFGGKITSPRALLTTAIEMVEQISGGLQVPQLSRQLASFSAQAKLLAIGTAAPDDPVVLVGTADTVSTIRNKWTALSSKAPERVTVVSPFWTEGSTAFEALIQLFQKLGSPAQVELVCRGERSPDSNTWLPVFDSSIATDLKKKLSGCLFLRAALPDAGVEAGPPADEVGDELEEKEMETRLAMRNRTEPQIQRALHAKMILLDGTAGSVLYVGSSNCTRRGLGLSGQSNFEAGFVYVLTPRQRKQISGLLVFAGPPAEVCSDSVPETAQPLSQQEVFVPTFLAEIVACESALTIRFSRAVPSDLVLLMPIPAKAGDAGYWFLFRAETNCDCLPLTVPVDLASCARCDARLEPIAAEQVAQPIIPNVFVEVRWEGHCAFFPVRFDDKARLPLLLAGRRPTEGEIIDYFLSGKEPDEWSDGNGLPNEIYRALAADTPIDTTRILAYFVRRFVQAIPGIETEIRRAAYSRASLDAALQGPTSPLELAEHAFRSLTRPPAPSEPPKTPIAVGFQIVEILAALLRCQSDTADPDLRTSFDPVVGRCREMLDTLISQEKDLQAEGFRLYQERILGVAR